MLKSLDHRHSLVGVEGEHLLQQVHGLGVGVGVQLREGDFGLERQGGEVATGLVIQDRGQILLRGGAQDPEDVVEPIKIMFTRKYRAV